VITADTITDEQIRELRDAAVSTGDGNTVRMAVLALGSSGYYEGWDCRVATGHERMSIDMGRAYCAHKLNAPQPPLPRSRPHENDEERAGREEAEEREFAYRKDEGLLRRR
jgi:hypothetical protein